MKNLGIELDKKVHNYNAVNANTFISAFLHARKWNRARRISKYKVW
jgi:hypothetical protein